MRKLTTYILAFFWIGLFAQERLVLESPLVGNYILEDERIPMVKGNLLNYKSADFPDLVIKYTHATPSTNKQVSKTSTIASDGSFDMKLDIGLGFQELYLSVGDLYFGKIIANKDLIINLDLAILIDSPVNYIGEGIEFSGSDALMNTFVNEFALYKIEKKRQIDEEKLEIVISQNISKIDKEKELKKVYKKQGNIEHQFAKKHGKQFEWILTNDRIAYMYADLFSIHWGKKMSKLLQQECLAFKPVLLSSASLRYYDFLGIYYKIPNRLETKLLTERTLRAQLDKKESSAKLDQFLREYDKKRDHLRYDVEVFQSGKKEYLETYEEELEMAQMDLHLKKINQLPKGKSSWVKLLSQPENLRLRTIYIDIIRESESDIWIIKLMSKDLINDQKVIDDMSEMIKDYEGFDSVALGISTHLEDCYVADATNIQTLISNIKSKYPDKAVIIDLWAPWISSCKNDLMINKSFSQALDTLPVQMVYLCTNIDVSQEKWEKELSTFPMSGTHIYLNDKLTSEVMDHFQINKYPTYFFIDHDGNFDKDLIPNLSQFNPRKLESRVRIKERI